MLPAFSHLLDPGALVIVVVGTMLASWARCGWRDSVGALRAAWALRRPAFDEEANRKALARALRAIEREGAHRANPTLPPDRELGLLVDKYLRLCSVEDPASAVAASPAGKGAQLAAHVRVFALAGDLAPVFGLVGTLYAITLLQPVQGGNAVEVTMAAIATAVLSSLYGVLVAHLVCFPLAGAIERRGTDYERQRAVLANWFETQLIAMRAQQRPHLRGVA